MDKPVLAILVAFLIVMVGLFVKTVTDRVSLPVRTWELILESPDGSVDDVMEVKSRIKPGVDTMRNGCQIAVVYNPMRTTVMEAPTGWRIAIKERRY